jgi:L-histidine N-alpha-methyltransferase
MSATAFATPRVARTDTPFARDVISGLSGRRKSVPSTWLYDQRGSKLFEDITLLDEYYLTRAEIGLLERHAPEVGALAGPRATVVEFGSGSSRKTPLLLAGLDRPGLYVPVDIAAQFMVESAHALKTAFPRLLVQPAIGDLRTLRSLPLPPLDWPWDPDTGPGRRVGFFPGSTIGNFAPDDAAVLLARFGRILGPGALLWLGLDGTQDPGKLLPAYDDHEGVTAQFNLNLLTRINAELGGDFEPETFAHQARWDPHDRCVEMHLVSRRSQTVEVLGRSFYFAAGESIHTESSYKVGPLRLQAIARIAGWSTLRVFCDERSQFNAYLLQRDVTDM